MARRPVKTAKSQPKADRPFAPGYGIVGAADGKGLLPWPWVARKMNRCRTFWLATIHAGRGSPHVMPVWGVWLDDAFFFSTGRKSRKGQNLAANPACTISFALIRTLPFALASRLPNGSCTLTILGLGVAQS